MAMTLLEAAKQLPDGEIMRRTVIEVYAEQSDLLRALPFETIQGNALKYNREGALPGIGFRGVNEGFTESVGVLNPVEESLVIAGGDLDVDRFILETMGTQRRSAHEAMKLKALAHNWTLKFIKGDSEVEPREFDGLQKRLVGNQLIDAGSASGGDALSLAKLDEAIDECDGPTHLLMNKTMRRRLTAASRDTTVGGQINFVQDQFGRTVTQYNDIPILIVDEDNSGNQILPFTEANPGGGAAASTSVYVVSLRPNWLSGIQNGLPDVRDLGELESKPVFRTRMEWYSAFTIFHPRAAVRLRGIKDAAVVV